MAVELPRIGRLEPQAPQSVGRFEANVPNFAEAAAPAMRGIAKGTDLVMDAVSDRDREIQKQRITALDIKSSDEENQYQGWSKQRLAEIKQKDGDTTEDYINYDKEAEEKYNQIFSKYESLDPQFKQMLDKKLKNTYNAQQTFRNIQQSEQTYKYRDSVYTTKAKLAVDNLMNAGQYADVTKPDTFGALQYHADQIIQTRIAQGSQTGILTPENEDDYMNTAVGVLIKKDMGDSVIPLVKSLNATGKVKEAKKVIDDYSQFLNAADKSTLLNDNNDADVKNQALGELAKLGPKASIEAINKLDVSEAIKLKSREIYHTNSLHQERENKLKAEATFKNLYNTVVRRQSGNQPFVSESELLDDPMYKDAEKMLEPSQLKTIQQLAMAPAKSEPKALATMMAARSNGELSKMDYKEYTKNLSKLNKDDRNTFEKSFNEETKPATDAAIRLKMNDTSKKFTNQITSLMNSDSDLVFPGKTNGKSYVFKDQALVAKYDMILRDRIKADPKSDPSSIVNSTIEDMKAEKMQLDKLNESWMDGIMKPVKDAQKGMSNIFGKKKLQVLPTSPAIRPTPKANVITNPAPTANAAQTLTEAPSNSYATWTSAQWIDDYKKNVSPKWNMEAVKEYKRKKLGQ